MPKLLRFAEQLGCHTKITVVRKYCSENPQWDYLRSVSGERHTSPIDRDYAIDRFHLLAAKKSQELARLVWKTMCSLPDTGHGYDSTTHQNPLRALYRKNERHGARFADSRLVHQLRSEAWVPQRGDEFVRPTHARAELLPDGFVFDPGWPWIKAIQFGRGIQLQNVKALQEAAATVERQRTCCAKWRHARGTPDAEVIDALRSARTPEITVSLAGEANIIRFVQVHLDDLRTIVSVTLDSALGRAAATGDV